MMSQYRRTRDVPKKCTLYIEDAVQEFLWMNLENTVFLGNPRKPSTDPPSKQSLDDPKRKNRKGNTTQSTDI